MQARKEYLPLSYKGRRLALFTTTAMYGTLAFHGALATHDDKRDGQPDQAIIAAGMRRYYPQRTIPKGCGWPIRQEDGSYVPA